MHAPHMAVSWSFQASSLMIIVLSPHCSTQCVLKLAKQHKNSLIVLGASVIETVCVYNCVLIKGPVFDAPPLELILLLHVAGPTWATARRPHSASFDGKHTVYGSPFPCRTWLSLCSLCLSCTSVRHALSITRLRETSEKHFVVDLDPGAGSLAVLG